MADELAVEPLSLCVQGIWDAIWRGWVEVAGRRLGVMAFDETYSFTDSYSPRARMHLAARTIRAIARSGFVVEVWVLPWCSWDGLFVRNVTVANTREAR